MIRVITDSTADLTPELIERFDLAVIPLYVRFGETVYRDGVDLTHEQFLALLSTGRGLPKTAQPTPADFVEFFRPRLEQGDEVIYVGLSSSLSGTFASAELARGQLDSPRLTLLDTRNLSMGVGLLAIEAAKLARAGHPLEEMLDRLGGMVPRLRTAFVVDSLDYLYKGGRLNAFQAALGSVLNIHPLIAVEEGRLIAAEKIRGNRARALDRLFTFCLPDPERVRPGLISVTHCACPGDAELLAERIRRAVPNVEVVITEAGAVIASHCGPNTVGILYIDR